MDNYYAFRCSDDTTLMNSSSGGAFYCLAQTTIYNNGIVYGVIIADDGADTVFEGRINRWCDSYDGVKICICFYE
jgi:hypothetical protein